MNGHNSPTMPLDHWTHGMSPVGLLLPTNDSLLTMSVHDLTRKLQRQNDSKIVLLVADGLGGLPLEPGGKTELETANTPNLDALASKGVARR